MGKKLSKSRIDQIKDFDYYDFETRINDLKNYCDIIEEQNTLNQILMKNQLLVTLYSTYEVKLKEFLSHLIDKYDLHARTIFPGNSIEIELDVLDDFKSDNFTKGKFLVANLHNVHPTTVSLMLNRITKLNYFKWYDIVLGDPDDSSLVHLDDLNKERNTIVHTLGNTNKSVHELRVLIDISSTIYSYVLPSTELILGILDNEWSNLKISKVLDSNFAEVDMSPVKIKKETLKLRKEYEDKYKK